MSRALKPKKLDSKFYRNLADNTEDGFGGMVLFVVTTVAFGWTAIELALAMSIFWLLVFLPALWVQKNIVSFYKNSIPLSSYSSDNAIYARAYGQITSILEPNSYEDAKELITNIWDHEQMMEKLNKHHDSEWHCQDCWKRYELIVKLRQNQPIPSVDGSDIERIEHKLNARKELAA